LTEAELVPRLAQVSVLGFAFSVLSVSSVVRYRGSAPGSDELINQGENAMKYMLLIYTDEKVWTEAEHEKCRAESTQLTHELNAKGQYLLAAPLHPVATATSVRVRNDKRMVTDGPFAETHEQLGGFYLIDAKDLDEAIAIAARIPPARKGTVEVRPVMELPGLPEAQA
jgi:hypothetical protein